MNNEIINLKEFACRLYVDEETIHQAIKKGKITACIKSGTNFQMYFEKAKSEFCNNVLLPEREDLLKEFQKEVNELPSIKEISLSFQGIPKELFRGIPDEEAHKIFKRLHDARMAIYKAAYAYENARGKLVKEYGWALTDYTFWIKDQLIKQDTCKKQDENRQ